MQQPWRVLLLDTKRSNPNHYLCLALRDALRAHPQVSLAVLADYGNAVVTARDAVEPFDLFLAFDGEEMDEMFCARVAGFCRRSVLWVTEDPYERAVNVDRSQLFDFVLTNDSASVEAYPGRGARHLPLAASEVWHHWPLPAVAAANGRRSDNGGRSANGAGVETHRYFYDVFFAGTAWPNRVALLQELTAELPDLKYKIALPHNEHLPRPELPALPASALSWRTPNQEFCRLANRSRITLGLHRDFSASAGNPSCASTPGPRLFETALAGGFQLLDGELAEVGDYYDVGTEVATFSDIEDCVEKVRHFLAHPGEREAMARAAQRTTQERHLYRHRVDKLLAWAAEIPVASESSSQRSPDIATNGRKATGTGAASGDSGGGGRNGTRRNLLYVAHNTVARGGPFGGVEVVLDLLSRDLREEFNVFSYVSEIRDGQSVGAVLYGPGSLELRRFQFPPIHDNVLLTCPAREAAFSQVLADCAIDLVHFHHLINHVPSLPLISRAYGIPGILTIYDYFHACTSFNLLDFNRQFCGAENLPLAACDVCLSAQFNYPRGSQARRRAFFARVFDALDHIIFISQDCRDRFEKIYSQTALAQKSSVTDLPLPYDEKPPLVPAAERWAERPIQIVSFGNFTYPKGADVMLRAFNQLRDGPFEFHLFGRLDEPYPAILEALNFPNVRIHRQFNPGSLQAALETAALSLHISIWPETFCITLSEAIHFGVVPIVSDLGAPGERVQDGVNGFKIPANSPGALVDLLERLAADPSPALEVAARIAPLQMHNAAEHAEAMATHYRALLGGTAPRSTTEVASSLPARLTLADCGPVVAEPCWSLNPPAPVLVSGATGEIGHEQLEPQAFAPTNQPPVKDPALLFKPGYIWRRAVEQTRQRGLRGSVRWHKNVLLKLVRGNEAGSRSHPSES